MHAQVSGRHRALRLLLVLAMCLAFIPVVPASAGIVPVSDTWYVDPVAGSDLAAGDSESTAFATIGKAVMTASSGDTVILLPGTFDAEEFPVPVSKALTIEGRDGAEASVVTTEGAAQLFSVQGEGDLVTFRGISFVGGEGLIQGGGAIYASGVQLIVEACEFRENSAMVGGALYSMSGNLTVRDSVFTQNGDETSDTPLAAAAAEDGRYTMLGGAIYAVMGGLTIEGSTFTDNGAYALAPAVFAGGVESMVSSSTFDGNQVTMWFELIGQGGAGAFEGVSAQETPFGEDTGALTYVDSLAMVSDSVFAENLAYNGAGVTALGSTVQITGSEFLDNMGYTGAAFFGDTLSLPQAPAGIAQFDSAPVAATNGFANLVDSCLFTGTTGGGFVLGFSGTGAEVVNSQFVANGGYYDPKEPSLYSVIAADSGMIVPNATAIKPAVVAAQVQVTNCTIADNDAESGVDASFGNVELMNTIVWNGIDQYSTRGVATILASDLETAPLLLDAGPSPVEPAFISDWISELPEFADPENGDYSLEAYSPCIDRGTDLASDMAPDDYNGVGRPIDGDEDDVAQWDMGAFEYDPWSDTRLGGSDRFDTSVEISERHYPAGADTVILATGMRFADGLAAAGLAGTYGAPILLTGPDALPQVVADEIVRLGAGRVVIMGGTNAVSQDVADEVASLGDITVDRIGGADRYETASMIAEEIIALAEEGKGFGGTFFIARGDLFADALTASPVAYGNRIPILLVAPDELPEATIDVIQAAGTERIVIVGGTAAVSRSVATQAAALADSSERIDGTDRYDTSANFSQWAITGSLATQAAVGIATGEKFPDALSGGAGIGSRSGVVLLTPQGSVNDSVADTLAGWGALVDSLEVFGGEGAVAAGVYDELVALVNP